MDSDLQNPYHKSGLQETDDAALNSDKRTKG